MTHRNIAIPWGGNDDSSRCRLGHDGRPPTSRAPTPTSTAWSAAASAPP